MKTMREANDSSQNHVFNIVIPSIRIMGVVMILFGTAIGMGYGNLFIPEVGLFIAIMGLFEFFAVPAVLTRVRDRRRIESLAGTESENRDQR
ncbi:MAG: hypothetical protein ABJN65_12320 [Parasphingorhabdus sp.]